jgi:hypothetical protein
MAIAKNFVQYGVWGVTKYGFTSTTSSPLWTFLLAMTYFIFGINEMAPLILNILFGTLLLIISHLILRKYVPNQLIIFTILLTALFVTPLPTLTFIGMEHILHILLTLCLVYSYIATLSAITRHRGYILLMVFALLITMTRFEGIFLIFVICLIFIWQKQVLYSGILGIMGLLPIIVYGIWSVSMGWYFLPNSIILKGISPILNLKGIAEWISVINLISRIYTNIPILILLIFSLLLLTYYIKKGISNDNKKIIIAIFIGTTLLHMQFVRIEWFYRYNAYIIFFGILILSSTIIDLKPKACLQKISWKNSKLYLVGLILIAIISFPFAKRAFTAIQLTPQATNNIYEQQYQMGRFLAKFYRGDAVAVNDIGAVSYMTNIQILDLWGLGNLELAKLKMNKGYNTEQIYNSAKKMGVTISIVYDEWFDYCGGIPSQWIKIGQWKVSNNVVLGENTVSIYAVNAAATDQLISNLKSFKTDMPKDIIQSGKYMEQN